MRSGVQAEGGRGTLGIACSAGTASAPVDVLSRVVTGRQALSGKSVGMGKSPGVLGARAEPLAVAGLPSRPQGVLSRRGWGRLRGPEFQIGITVFAPVLGAQVLDLPGFLPPPQPCRPFFQFWEPPVCEIAESQWQGVGSAGSWEAAAAWGGGLGAGLSLSSPGPGWGLGGGRGKGLGSGVCGRG